MKEREQIEIAIKALEGYRDLLGAAVVEPAVTAMREKLDRLIPTRGNRAKRKQITVLFADIAGFTSMSEDLDAEEVNRLINELWDSFDGIITRYGGHIDKHMGDGVMAIWGARNAREDDPERAIRASIDMHTALQEWRKKNPVHASIGLRIGINTGLALLGVIGSTKEFTAVGDTVNVASRLESAAPINHTLISHATYIHVRGLFEVHQLEPIPLKGKSTTVQIYLVGNAKPNAFRIAVRGIEGVETRTVGREAELEKLQGIWKDLITNKRLQLVTLTGDAGIGKSRLLYETQNLIELHPAQCWTFHARATQNMFDVPFSLIRELFTFYFRTQKGETQELLLDIFTHFLGEGGPHKARAVSRLLGFYTDKQLNTKELDELAMQQLREETFLYIEQLFKAIMAEYPIVVYLEDLHWADDGSLDLLTHLAQKCANLPLMFIYTTRPTIFSRRFLWPGLSSHHTQFMLSPLSKKETYQLTKEILQKAESVPAELLRFTHNMSAGNPFYVEEIIKKLIEDGIIVVSSPTTWIIRAERLDKIQMPATLVGLLQARLDSLPPFELRAIQKAAVVGRVFWDGAVSALQLSFTTMLNGDAEPDSHWQQTREALDNLTQRELIYQKESSTFKGQTEYYFKHYMLYEVAYDSVLKRERALYHEQTARWLMQHSGDRIGRYARFIAKHLELAHNKKQAADWYVRAAKQAVNQAATTEALHYTSLALTLTDDEAYDQQFEILLMRESLYFAQGDRRAQKRDLQQLKRLASHLGGEDRQAEIKRREQRTSVPTR